MSFSLHAAHPCLGPDNPLSPAPDLRTCPCLCTGEARNLSSWSRRFSEGTPFGVRLKKPCGSRPPGLGHEARTYLFQRLYRYIKYSMEEREKLPPACKHDIAQHGQIKHPRIYPRIAAGRQNGWRGLNLGRYKSTVICSGWVLSYNYT